MSDGAYGAGYDEGYKDSTLVHRGKIEDIKTQICEAIGVLISQSSGCDCDGHCNCYRLLTLKILREALND